MRRFSATLCAKANGVRSFARFERVRRRVLSSCPRADRINGTIYYLVGVLVVLTFFPRGAPAPIPPLPPSSRTPATDPLLLFPRLPDIACLSIVILSLCDTSASVFGRLYGKYTPKLPFSGTLFGAKKSLAGTVACVATGTLSAYVFWSRYAALGDEGDCSWLPARAASTWAGPPSRDPTFLPRVASPSSRLPLWALSLSSGVVAGIAEVSGRVAVGPAVCSWRC